MSSLIIDGVTGAGKSETLAAMRRHPRLSSWLANAVFIDEDEVLGPLMEQLKDSGIDAKKKWAPLLAVLDRLESKPGNYLIERFHPTFHALVPDQKLFEAVDRRLKALGFSLTLLHYNEGRLRERGLDRADRRDTSWNAEMLEFYGGEEKALQAIAESQRRRHECLAHSRLPLLRLDTTNMLWDEYAGLIAEFLSRLS
jgi:hypothetical protein